MARGFSRRWGRSALIACGILSGIVASAACGSSDDAPPSAADAASEATAAEASVDDARHDGDGEAGDAGPPRDEQASGRRILTRPAQLAGLTSDGYVVFTEVNATGHSVAKVIATDGSGETTLATSSGTGKADLRFEIRGKVVFVWADRGNRMGTLTLWSKASGVVVKGPGARPGQAAASADGGYVAYLRDVTATTANIVAGPIGGAQIVVGAINAQDDTCWRNLDLASAGGATPRFLARFCAFGGSVFGLRSIAPNGSSGVDLASDAEEGTYGKTRVFWRETGGAVRSSLAGGGSAVTLAASAAAYNVSRDESLVLYRTAEGAIFSVPADGSSAPVAVVAAPDGQQIGTISNDNQRLLFASHTQDKGMNQVAPYTDVKVVSLLGDAGPPTTLVTGTTSCPNCVFDAFTPDGTLALVLDPIDNSQSADGVGPLHVFGIADGTSKTSFGTKVFTSLALGTGSGLSSRFLFVDASPDATLVTGYAYGLFTRSLGTNDPSTTLARGAEQVSVDAAHTNAVFSFANSGALAGIWIAPLL